jgi:hypothetical protein
VPALPQHLEAVLEGTPELDSSRGLLE